MLKLLRKKGFSKTVQGYRNFHHFGLASVLGRWHPKQGQESRQKHPAVYRLGRKWPSGHSFHQWKHRTLQRGPLHPRHVLSSDRNIAILFWNSTGRNWPANVSSLWLVQYLYGHDLRPPRHGFHQTRTGESGKYNKAHSGLCHHQQFRFTGTMEHCEQILHPQ